MKSFLTKENVDEIGHVCTISCKAFYALNTAKSQLSHLNKKSIDK